jgi:hypothetical protein
LKLLETKRGSVGEWGELVKELHNNKHFAIRMICWKIFKDDTHKKYTYDSVSRINTMSNDVLLENYYDGFYPETCKVKFTPAEAVRQVKRVLSARNLKKLQITVSVYDDDGKMIERNRHIAIKPENIVDYEDAITFLKDTQDPDKHLYNEEFIEKMDTLVHSYKKYKSGKGKAIYEAMLKRQNKIAEIFYRPGGQFTSRILPSYTEGFLENVSRLSSRTMNTISEELVKTRAEAKRKRRISEAKKLLLISKKRINKKRKI